MTMQCVSYFVPHLLLYVQSRDREEIYEELVHRFSLPEDVATKETLTVSLDAMRKIGDATATVLDEPLLGVQIAVSRKRPFGLFEFIVSCTSTLGEALDCLVRFHELVTDGLVFDASRTAGKLTVRCFIPDEPECMGRHGNEYVVATVLRVLRDLSARHVAVESASFAHAAPSEAVVAELCRFLGTERVTFGTGVNTIVLDEKVTRLPVVTSNPKLLAALLEHTAKLPKEDRAIVDFGALVRTRIRADLESEPSIERVASLLKMSPRTLQRRLTDLGTTFKRLVDEERRTRAFADITENTIRMQEIAFRVGYRDQRAFLRAFRRWTGQSPTQYRAARRVQRSGAHSPGKHSKAK